MILLALVFLPLAWVVLFVERPLPRVYRTARGNPIAAWRNVLPSKRRDRGDTRERV